VRRTDTATTEKISFTLTAKGKSARSRPKRTKLTGTLLIPIPKGVTASNPIPLTTPALVGRWRIAVRSVAANATEAVLAAGQFNRAPDPDQQDYIATIAATNLGGAQATFENDIDLRVVGQSLLPYDIYSNSCGTIPNPIPVSPVLRGGSFEGNACWRVQSTDVATLGLYATSGDTGQRVFFALTP
jgi:hypothetical protein